MSMMWYDLPLNPHCQVEVVFMIVVVVEVVKLQVVASGGSPVFLWLQLWC
jgi:hypothetical protein